MDYGKELELFDVEGYWGWRKKNKKPKKNKSKKNKSSNKKPKKKSFFKKVFSGAKKITKKISHTFTPKKPKDKKTKEISTKNQNKNDKNKKEKSINIGNHIEVKGIGEISAKELGNSYVDATKKQINNVIEGVKHPIKTGEAIIKNVVDSVPKFVPHKEGVKLNTPIGLADYNVKKDELKVQPDFGCGRKLVKKIKIKDSSGYAGMKLDPGSAITITVKPKTAIKNGINNTKDEYNNFLRKGQRIIDWQIYKNRN